MFFFLRSPNHNLHFFRGQQIDQKILYHDRDFHLFTNSFSLTNPHNLCGKTNDLKLFLLTLEMLDEVSSKLKKKLKKTLNIKQKFKALSKLCKLFELAN